MATLLFVDDDPAIRQTLPAILAIHGFEVTVAANVPEALVQITSRHFDVLISDLNIGEPGDGFTVVSAMRRSQPECISFILTGYPALETALQAIRSQVDDYFIKPADITRLVSIINERLQERKPHRPAATKRVAEILRENVEEIVRRTLQSMKAEPTLAILPLMDAERSDPFRPVLVQLAEMLEGSQSNELSATVISAARLRGKKRYEQGYSLLQLITNANLMEGCVFEVVHEHLLSMDLSCLMLDLKRLNHSLGLQLQETIRAYLDAQQSDA